MSYTLYIAANPENYGEIHENYGEIIDTLRSIHLKYVFYGTIRLIVSPSILFFRVHNL